MLALRLARGARPLVLLRRLMVAVASGGVGFLLLSVLGHALGHSQQASGSVTRLLWCVVPLAAAVQLAVAVARTDPGARPHPGLASAGFGPVRLAALAATSTAMTTALGSVLALLTFLYLRGDLGGIPYSGAAAAPLGAGRGLPVAGAVTLLSVTPAVAGTAVAIALRPRRSSAGGAPDPRRPAATSEAMSARTRATVFSGLPWGVALTAAGIALGAYAGRAASGSSHGPLPLPGHLETVPAGVAGGWVLIATGLVLACPGLTHLCGRLLSSGRPGALRLLSGRVLQEEARRIGRPLGVLCAVVAGAVAAVQLYGVAPGGSGGRSFGPLTGGGAALVMACAAATVLIAAFETKSARSETTAALRRMGASSALLRRAAALSGLVTMAVMAPLTWAIAVLAELPLR